VSVGNDVVDLADAESRREGLHPRWGERVFTASERAALDASPPSEQHRLHWALWAAKESAFKARKRNHPEAAFSPRELVVELSPLPPGDGIAAGRVVHRGDVFTVEVRLEGTCLHAVATSANATGQRIPPAGGTTDGLAVKAVAAAGEDPSRDVRRLAAAALGSALHFDPRQLRITGRPPVVLHRGRGLDVILSLSHHGRFVAFACTLPSRPRTV
jgi:hypothetical protein